MRKVLTSTYFILALVLFVFSVYLLFFSFKKEISFELDSGELVAAKKEKREKVTDDTHMSTPEVVRAVYMSQCGAKSPKIRKHIKDLILSTKLNAVVIDIKDYTGTVSFPTNLKAANEGKGCIVSDMKDLIKDFHKNGIYVIGRITVFQDPLYARAHPELAVQSKSKKAPWSDWRGLHFIDVGARDFWKYILKISHEAHQEYYFDELNYDYIRFPSDGPMSDAEYLWSDYNNRAEELENFFRFISYNAKVPDKQGHIPKISADLFGMVTTNYDDLTIGQLLEKALPYFDYIAPMVYPSHYPKSFLGLGNPNKHVYTVVNYSMKKAIERTEANRTKIKSRLYKESSIKGVYIKPKYNKNKLRAWLQDFDYGGNYGVKEVKDQIKALEDLGLYSYMIWDPANIYTKGAYVD